MIPDSEYDDPAFSFEPRDAYIYAIDAFLFHDQEQFQETCELIRKSLLTGITHFKKDLVAIVFHNTKNSPNYDDLLALDLNNGVAWTSIEKNQSRFLPLDTLSTKSVGYFYEFISKNYFNFEEKYGVEEGSFESLLQLCSRMFDDHRPMPWRKTIVYFTNKDSPHTRDTDEYNIALSAAMDLRESNTYFDVIPMSNNFDYNLFFKKFLCSVDGTNIDHFETEDLEMKKRMFKNHQYSLNFRSTCLRQLKWIMGDGVELSVSYFNLYNLHTQPKPVDITPTNYFRPDIKVEPDESTVPPINDSTSTLSPDPVRFKKEEPELFDECIYASNGTPVFKKETLPPIDESTSTTYVSTLSPDPVRFKKEEPADVLVVKKETLDGSSLLNDSMEFELSVVKEERNTSSIQAATPVLSLLKKEEPDELNSLLDDSMELELSLIKEVDSAPVTSNISSLVKPEPEDLNSILDDSLELDLSLIKDTEDASIKKEAADINSLLNESMELELSLIKEDGESGLMSKAPVKEEEPVNSISLRDESMKIDISLINDKEEHALDVEKADKTLDLSLKKGKSEELNPHLDESEKPDLLIIEDVRETVDLTYSQETPPVLERIPLVEICANVKVETVDKEVDDKEEVRTPLEFKRTLSRVMITSLEYPGGSIPLKKKELAELKAPMDPSIQLIGFVDNKDHLLEHFLKPSGFIYPDVRITGSIKLFTGIWQKCLELKKFAFCSLLKRINTYPNLVLLKPTQRGVIGNFRSQDGFGVHFLPSSDNIRNISLNQWITNRPTEDQVTFFSDIVQTREMNYDLESELLADPDLDHLNSKLIGLAVGENDFETNNMDRFFGEDDASDTKVFEEKLMEIFGEGDITGKKRPGGENGSASKKSKVSDEDINQTTVIEMIKNNALNDFTVPQLKAYLKKIGQKGFGKLNKPELISKIIRLHCNPSNRKIN